MKNTKITLTILVAGCFLTACTKGDTLVFDTRLGPVTSQQIQSLPNTLDGDTKNARHTSYTLEGKGMKDPKGNNE